MGKYRLKSKQKGSVITLMEVDTECQAWYIQADDRNAALQVLKAMSDEIRCLRNIYLNGDDVTEEVCPLLMTIGDASLPEEEFSELYGAGNPDGGMDMHRTEDSPEGEADSEPVFTEISALTANDSSLYDDTALFFPDRTDIRYFPFNM